jgi:hypothetical protein
VSIKSFTDYKHLLQENYVEYKHFFYIYLKLVSTMLCHVFIVQLLYNLKARITITEDMLENTWREIDY